MRHLPILVLALALGILAALAMFIGNHTLIVAIVGLNFVFGLIALYYAFKK